jgi:hypothetical protein
VNSFTDLPDLVRDSVVKGKDPKEPVRNPGEGKIPPGSWHNRLVSFAGTMFNNGITSAEGLYKVMLAYAGENFDTSVEPLDKEKVAQIARNAAANFEAAKPTAVSPDWVKPTDTSDPLAADIGGEKQWLQAALELTELRKGIELVKDESGKTRAVKKAAHIVNTEVFAFVVKTLKHGMKARFFVDAYPYVFLPRETRIYDFHNDEAVYQILSRFGLLCTERHYDLVQENLHQKILFQGTPVHIEKFGCMRGEAIYVNNGRGGIIKITADNFEEVPNGTDDVYVINRHLQAWPSLDRERLSALTASLNNGGKVSDSKLCQMLNAYFEEDEKLTGAQYQQLVLLRFLSLFLGNIDLRPIMLALGPQNSGKSTLWEKIMWTFYGTNFVSSGLPPKLADFISAITNHQIQVFDNIDRAAFGNTHTDYPTYVDLMCKSATGGKISLRKLYENNIDKNYDLRCDIFLTARVNPFPSNYSDLLRRTLIFPIRLPTQEEHRTTESMKAALRRDEEIIKLEILVRLQFVLRALLGCKEEQTPISEMASFETYTMRVAQYEGWDAEMRLIWEGYSGAYKERLTEDSPLINFVRCWLGKRGNVGRKARTGQIYRDLTDMLGTKFTQHFRSDAAFGRKLKENLSALGLLGIHTQFKDGSTVYWFEPSPEQVGQCKNAYEDSVSRWRQEFGEQPDPDVID